MAAHVPECKEVGGVSLLVKRKRWPYSRVRSIDEAALPLVADSEYECHIAYGIVAV